MRTYIVCGFLALMPLTGCSPSAKDPANVGKQSECPITYYDDHLLVFGCGGADFLNALAAYKKQPERDELMVTAITALGREMTATEGGIGYIVNFESRQ